jgi:hypothetical protein
MNKKGFVLPLVAVSILVISVLAYFYLLKPKETTTAPSVSETGLIQNDTHNGAVQDDVLLMQEDETTLTADLIDVSGGNSSGKGYINRAKGLLMHRVVANLPDPRGSNFYEGWLVQQEPTLKFFSTGVMTKEANGLYLLIYESVNLYEGYNFVVITLETVKDETPETHIIEGLAE